MAAGPATSATPLETAQARIADCLQLDGQGRLVQRRDYLNLSGLELTDAQLAEAGLAQLPHLRYLDLTRNQLTELPECVTGCTGLIWLGLNFNRIEKLPEKLGALVNLQRLYLRGNLLTELPRGIGDLAALQELDLTYCELAQLPSSMARLESLEHIALGERALAPELRAAWKEQQWQSLREHLARTAKEVSATQFVGKVVLAGSQENGKTC